MHLRNDVLNKNKTVEEMIQKVGITSQKYH